MRHMSTIEYSNEMPLLLNIFSSKVLQYGGQGITVCFAMSTGLIVFVVVRRCRVAIFKVGGILKDI